MIKLGLLHSKVKCSYSGLDKAIRYIPCITPTILSPVISVRREVVLVFSYAFFFFLYVCDILVVKIHELTRHDKSHKVEKHGSMFY